jgi:RNA polymerase sigma factor (sigma-70 family)
MAEKLLQAAIRLLGRQALRQFSDADLLERFTTTRDEAAFAALVDRYGGLVLRLCRRLFPQTQDAEDCFQAAFILLAEKAGTIRKTQAVSSWLYGATQRVAMNAKRQAARRRKHEQGAAASQPSSRSSQPSEIVSLRELQALLDAEVANLPEKYRAPFVLCCLEGKSGQDAARELGCKEGTVTARITQARHLLRRRLARRGVTLSAALTATFIAPAAAVAVPRPLAATTLEAALRYALNRSTAAIPSTAVAALVKGTSKAMLLSKTKTVTLVMILVLTGTGLATISYEATARREDNTREALLTPVLAAEPRSGMTERARVDLYGDPLPVGALARLGTVRFRQRCAIGQFAFMPDRHTVVTGENNWINFWNLATGKIIRRLDASRGIDGLALSPDGSLLAVGNSRIQLFDVSTGRQRCQFGEGTRISSLVFSPDGKTLASCVGLGGPLPKGDTTIQLWDIATGREPVRLSGHTDTVNLPSFSPDGKILASTSWGDPAIHLWDTTTGKEARQLKYTENSRGPVPPCVAFSPDGKLLASTDYYNDTVCFWDSRTYQVIRRIRDVHDVQGICFSPNSRTLAVEGKKLLLYDTVSGKMMCELNGYSDADPIKPIQSYPSLRFSGGDAIRLPSEAAVW